MVAMLICSVSYAGLGGQFTDVPHDTAGLQAHSFAAIRPTGASYTREQITLPGGGRVVEYVDAGVPRTNIQRSPIEYGLKEHQLNEELPRIDRERTDSY